MSRNLPGDFNLDGVWDTRDVDLLADGIVGGENNTTLDLTGDGVVDDVDLARWLAIAVRNLKAQWAFGWERPLQWLIPKSPRVTCNCIWFAPQMERLYFVELDSVSRNGAVKRAS